LNEKITKDIVCVDVVSHYELLLPRKELNTIKNQLLTTFVSYWILKVFYQCRAFEKDQATL
jgi:hypothetical protein